MRHEKSSKSVMGLQLLPVEVTSTGGVDEVIEGGGVGQF
jgi:hypothetical protein